MHISNSSYSSFYSSYSKAINQDSKSLQDFRLTNAESEKIQVSASESLQTETSQTTMLSDEEIFNKVWENIDFFYITSRESRFALGDIELDVGGMGGITLDMQDPYFNERIDNKINDNWGQKITQEEMQEAQKFLNEQMDNLMLKLYKTNPKVTEDTLKGLFILYSNDGIPRDYPELEYDGKLSDILRTYGGCRIEADGIDDEDYEKFLYGVKEYLSDTEKPKEIDRDTLSVIRTKVAIYNYEKILATGYDFFSALSDRLSPMEQEQIIDAIAKVIGFYSQANSIEINGIKISWEPQSDDFGFGVLSIVDNVLLMNFEISYPQSNLFGNVSDNLLVSLTSNFNPTQSVLEILEQKDEQEQENQNQALGNQDSESQTLANQTLESRQAKKAYEDYKSNPLTSKASKEINDFVNEVIRKAKA